MNERVEKAVEEILAEREAGERPNIAETAREWNASKHRVHRRLRGIGSRSSRKPTNTKLSEAQRTLLLQHVLNSDERGKPTRYDYVSKVANEVLKEDHKEDSPAPVVGRHWARRFLDRHPELHEAKPRPGELERKLAHGSSGKDRR